MPLLVRFWFSQVSTMMRWVPQVDFDPMDGGPDDIPEIVLTQPKVTDGTGTPDPNPISLVNWCFWYDLGSIAFV